MPIVSSDCSVLFLSDWDAATRTVKFGDTELISPDIYTVANSVDMSRVDGLLNKYVLVTTEQGNGELEYTITSIEPVESAIGIVSVTGEHFLTIDGTTYPVREGFGLESNSYDGEEILYHIHNGTIVGLEVLEEKTGTLEIWDVATGQITINESRYLTNYLTDLPADIDKMINMQVTYVIVGNTIFRITFAQGSNSIQISDPVCVRVGENFEIKAHLPFFSSFTENIVNWSVKDESILQVVNAQVEINEDKSDIYLIVRLIANCTGASAVICSVAGFGNASCDVQVEIDRWSFVNANNKNGGKWPHDGGYYITDEDYSRLVQNLDSVEKQKISYPQNSWITVKSRYNKESALRPLFVEWSGSCDGMSRWACLVGSGILSPEVMNQKTLYEAKNLSLPIQSAINYYHNQQHLSYWKEEQNRFMTCSQAEQLNSLSSYVLAAGNGGPPVYIAFQWYEKFKDDGQCDTSKSSSHAIIGYGIEDGNWCWDVNGQKLEFVHRVLIYDCNTGKGKVSDHNLYFNEAGTWYIPHYNAISINNGVTGKDNNAQFQIISNDTSIINLVDYRTGETKGSETAGKSIMLLAPSDIIYTVSNGEDTYKINGFSVIESNNNKNLNVILDSNITAEGERVPSEATVILAEEDAEYTVTTQENSSGFSMTYGNYLETAAMNSAGSIIFKPNGSFTMQATKATNYSLSITANNGYAPLPWYTIAVTGNDVVEASIAPTTDGIILNSDNLNDVTIYGINDDETKVLTFSTDENSVLVTDEANELIILTDADGDGKYETPVDVVPKKDTCVVVFDTNGGNLSGIGSMNTDKSGKLANLPAPTRNGYTFAGWYTAISGGEKISTNYIFTSNTTIYAHWTQNSGNSTGNSTPGNSSSGSGSSGGSSSNGGSSHSGSSSHSISTEEIEHGSVTISPKNPSQGTKVTLTVQPDSGYILNSLAVIDSNGCSVELTKESDTKYTFTMPDSKVTISASFKKAVQQATVEISFIDVSPNAYYYDAVDWAVQQGITKGTTVNTFSPDTPCTRAQVVTFLWRSAGSPMVSRNNPFTDVASGSYYYNAVLWAVEQGITVGTTATTFNPDAVCTRGQAVAFLYRASGSPATTGNHLFEDISANAYYTDAVQWAVNEGVTFGKNPTAFSPNDNCSRAQIVTFLYRNRVN